MTLPRWFVAPAIAALAMIGVLLAADWITDERLGAWAPYSIAVALILLMILSLGAMWRPAAARRHLTDDAGAGGPRKEDTP
ncbi:MAG TPA: hypothetical protein VD995_20425 [Azospirillum sp.]|nr:hypothetical protein [Azospirillum sp.]